MVPSPTTLGLLLCDQVIVEEGTKKVSLIGTHTTFGGSHFPVPVPSFSLVALLTDGMGTGRVEVLLTRLDSAASVYVHRGSLHFPSRLAEVYFHARFERFSFPAPGAYQFTLLVDGDWVAQRTVRVSQKED